jgi:serine/threonine protein kinase
MNPLSSPTQNHASAPASGDPRLTAALEEYRALLEAGQRPDRAAFLTRHADLGPALAECLAGLELVHAVAPALSGANADPPIDAPADPLLEPLGDFRILRKISRGGMGVVYEAEQTSLGRRVALKVLPFAGALDARQLQRFKNEAQAAAGLHHTNIVPVHYVGCERGVHFYAMQYIEGQSLADVIAELLRVAGPESSKGVHPAKPELLRVARPESSKGVHAAKPTPFQDSGRATPAASDATTAYTQLPDGRPSENTKPIAGLSTAHSMKDTTYFRTVAELGIQAAEALDYAHQMGVIHRDVKPANLLVDATGRLWVTDFGLAQVQSDTRLTLTGDLVGTLRYMSPEQALAKRVVVDHRTDIYSLGATLYELLTLEPAYRGNDRQELLRQIAFEEPTAPRRVNKAIPVELETIVLKALEKNPAERYATAQELADDLRRYIGHEPIRARRAGIRSRLSKWARRHQGIVLASSVGLVIAVVTLAASLIVIAQQRNEVERERQTAVEQRDEADRQRQRADENFRKAVMIVDRLLQQANQQNLPRTSEVVRVQKALADEAVPYFQELLQENRSDPKGRQLTAVAFEGLGIAHHSRGEFAMAAQAIAQSRDICKHLAVQFPDEPVHAKRLRDLRYQLFLMRGDAKSVAEAAADAGQHSAAAAAFRDVVSVCKLTEIDLEGETITGTAVLNDQAAMQVKMADELWAAGQSQEAERVYGDALATCDLLGRLPEEKVSPVLSLGLKARAQATRGLLRADSGRLKEAEQDLRDALHVVAGIKPEFQQVAVYGLLKDPARVHSALGNILLATRRHEEATGEFCQAEKEWHRMKDFHLGDNQLAWFLATCPDKQFRNPMEAVKLAQRAVEALPEKEPWRTVGVVHRRPGDYRRTLGVALYRAGDWTAAAEALRKGADLRQGGDSSDWFFLAMATWQLGNKDKARQLYVNAVAWMDKNQPKNEELLRFRTEAADLLKIDDRLKKQPD